MYICPSPKIGEGDVLPDFGGRGGCTYISKLIKAYACFIITHSHISTRPAQALLQSLSHFVLKFGQSTVIGKRSSNDCLLPVSPSRGNPPVKRTGVLVVPFRG